MTAGARPSKLDKAKPPYITLRTANPSPSSVCRLLCRNSRPLKAMYSSMKHRLIINTFFFTYWSSWPHCCDLYRMSSDKGLSTPSTVPTPFSAIFAAIKNTSKQCYHMRRHIVAIVFSSGKHYLHIIFWCVCGHGWRFRLYLNFDDVLNCFEVTLNYH